jgi:hypothetical protein
MPPASTLLWLDYNHYYSDDAAEALTSQAPDGYSSVHTSSIHTHAGQEDKDGDWICPKGEEVLQMAGVLMIEEYVHSGERQS